MAVLSISSKYKTGATEIALELEKDLGYSFIRLGGRGGLLHKANQLAKKMKLVSAEDGKALMNHTGENEFISFMSLVQSVIYDQAANDNVIILSRGGNYLLKDIPHVLRIRVEASVEYRIGQFMAKEEISHETARLLMKQADREIDCTIYELFGKGWSNPEAYDMEFHVPKQSHKTITEMVKNFLLTKDALKTPEAVELLRLKSLAAKVKAKVAVNPAFYATTLDLEITGNGILLRGLVRGNAGQQKIEKDALKIAGATPLICELSCYPLKKSAAPT
ncbi:MAG: cytidylate kinase-like family protein [Syntrophaceae bacterium]|nr:cytidylate kinase-like family protein [Syntrophaceae bacterium]